MPEPEKPEAPVVPSPIVEADKTPPMSIPWYQSPQALAAIAAIAGGLVGFSHFLCAGLGFCILEKISASTWTMGLGGLLAIVGGGFALYRRIKVGLDPLSDASKLNLF